MQISYPYIVWNNVTKFHENRASNFWAFRQIKYVGIVVLPEGDTTLGAGPNKLDRYPFIKMRKWQEQYPYRC